MTKIGAKSQLRILLSQWNFHNTRLLPARRKILPPLVIKTPPIITELDKESETFNKPINLEGQTPKTPVSNTEAAAEVIATIVSNIL